MLSIKIYNVAIITTTVFFPGKFLNQKRQGGMMMMEYHIQPYLVKYSHNFNLFLITWQIYVYVYTYIHNR